jgi:hypothetical protein
MKTTDYKTSSQVNKPASEVFKALTEEIALWWSTIYSGNAKKAGDSFRVEFNKTFMEFTVEEASANKIVWLCTDIYNDIPHAKNKTEWIGTKIVWEMEPATSGSKVTLTHEGLTPELECYEICNNGWNYYFGSLIALVNTGMAVPFPSEAHPCVA